ncbi:MAG: coenzyme F430 synthase [Methanobrevibacter sp.]|uniref:coenzyme F430 synthase n=1 Tax=Methanobrevibacter sp. TaxID=66852 RepID=UPI0026E0E7C3|nr:coenzyme F430 synthase [Methanobrevibacter sp.]MDO5848270.1 coenzyme F430 synthase [Methanobrevibacter sp.]
MDCLIIDATHGGVKLAAEFSKLDKYENIYLYDIYNTLNEEEITKLTLKEVKIRKLEEIESDELIVVYPIHLPLSKNEIIEKIECTELDFITHHEAVKLLLKDFFKKYPKIPKIEITGVKGKTSSVFMLKEILKDLHPLILSSLGIIQVRDNHEIRLKKNVSITPANIKEAVDLAYRIDNPACNWGCKKNEITDFINYGSLILESSLGVTGIGDVGLLTNIVENYPIAKNRSDAKTAKSQVFRCGKIAIKKETLDKHYNDESDRFKDKINTFSIDDEKSNVHAKDINYDIDGTSLKVIYENVKTINDNLLSGCLEIESFAMGPHHIENILGVITTALTLETSETDIINGLANYKGIEGRTNIRNVGDLKIIEEINPGINTKAIEFSIDMLKNPEKYCIIIGGDYGITCEEIDEEKVAGLLNENVDLNLILTGEVGRNINEKLNKSATFIENYNDAIKYAINRKLNVLFIYRSDYRKLSQR